MRILLVKLSSLGDVVHTLPVVQDILQALPDSQIDWVVEEAFASLLAHSRGLGRVIPCALRRWRKSVFAASTRSEWRAFRAALQAEKYHAVIDLQGLSKSALVARLARLAAGGKRYALANQTEGSAYEVLTRFLADVAVSVPVHIHAVWRGRELCAGALSYPLTSAVDYGLAMPMQAQEGVQRKTILLVHGTSRADKAWPLSQWIELGRNFLNAGWQIALPHGNDIELATSQAITNAINVDGANVEGGNTSAVVWPRLTLDSLAQRMAACTGVIGVDSGLSHIAVALNLPHVQIYNFNTAWRTGPLAGVSSISAGACFDKPRQVSVFEQPSPSVDAVWRAWQACFFARSRSELTSSDEHDFS